MLSIGAEASERADVIHDVASPAPVAVSIESSPPDGRDAYRIGETISVRATFDQPVTVDQTAGSPSLALTLGDRERQAIYSNGSNTRDLRSSVATTVTAVQGRVDDDAETILITASHGGGMIGAEQTITIIDDDATPAVTTCSGGMAGT